MKLFKTKEEKLEEQIEDLEIEQAGIKLYLLDENVFFGRGDHGGENLVDTKIRYRKVSEKLNKKRTEYGILTGSYPPSLNLRGGIWKIHT